MSAMSNPSDEEPQADRDKPADPPPTQPMYGQTYGDGGSLPPTHSPYGSSDQSSPSYGQTPSSPYGQAPASPYGQPGQAGQPGQSGQPAQPAYGQYGQPGYGTPPPPAPYGQSAYGNGSVQDSGATTSMVLGIIGLASVAFCAGVLLILSPVALFMGRAARNRIDASNGALRGRAEAQAGFVTGIIGTVLLAIGILVAIIVMIVAIAAASHDGGGVSTYDNDGSYSSNA